MYFIKVFQKVNLMHSMLLQGLLMLHTQQELNVNMLIAVGMVVGIRLNLHCSDEEIFVKEKLERGSA